MTDTKVTHPLHLELADGLRKVADFVEANPELAEYLRYSFDMVNAYSNDPEVLAAFIKAGKRHGAEATKAAKGDEWFYARLRWGRVELHVNAHRNQVCEARQVGTKTVKQKDPAALAAVPEVEVEVPVYEWDCKPLLAAEQPAAVSS